MNHRAKWLAMWPALRYTKDQIRRFYPSLFPMKLARFPGFFPGSAAGFADGSADMLGWVKFSPKAPPQTGERVLGY
jgi:hypothetical protein